MKKPQLSFVIPARDEEKSIGSLYSEIVSECQKLNRSYEIIFIDDGSKDSTYKTIVELRKHNSAVKVIKHRGSFGKSITLQNGFAHSSGEIVFTLDADLQDNPNEISLFIKKLDEGYDFHPLPGVVLN